MWEGGVRAPGFIYAPKQLGEGYDFQVKMTTSKCSILSFKFFHIVLIIITTLKMFKRFLHFGKMKYNSNFWNKEHI